MSDMRTPVWELVGLTSQPGLLTLSGGVLSLRTEQGSRFECPLSQLKDVKWPWYSFNAALNVNANGTKYRISFARPNGAGAAWYPAGVPGAIFDLGGALATGKAWRAELEKQMG